MFSWNGFGIYMANWIGNFCWLGAHTATPLFSLARVKVNRSRKAQTSEYVPKLFFSSSTRRLLLSNDHARVNIRQIGSACQWWQMDTGAEEFGRGVQITAIVPFAKCKRRIYRFLLLCNVLVNKYHQPNQRQRWCDTLEHDRRWARAKCLIWSALNLFK